MGIFTVYVMSPRTNSQPKSVFTKKHVEVMTPHPFSNEINFKMKEKQNWQNVL